VTRPIPEDDQTAAHRHDRGGEIETDEIRVSEERFRALFEAAQVGILLCDVDGSIVFSNHHADDLLDRQRHQSSLDMWMAAIHEDDRTAVEEMMVLVSSGTHAVSRRYRVTTTAGDMRWVDQTATPLRRRDDEIEGSVSTLIDSTVEVESAVDLRRSRDFADGLLDTAGALVVVLDRDACIVRFNKACERATGWRSEEAIGRSVVEFLVPVDQQIRVDELMLDMLSSPSPTSMENDWIAKDGSRVRIGWHNTVVIDDDGDGVAITCIGIDVTRQRLLESRLAQTDRLQSVGRLAAGIAHDFNNTLAVLLLRIERLQTTDQAQRDNVDALKRTIEHSKTTIADLLLLSRHQELDPTSTDVNAELERHEAMFHDLLGDDVELVFELTSDDSTAVLDSARFEQIIVNLVVNAHDAMADGGTMTLRTQVVDLDVAIDGGWESSHHIPLTLTSGCYLCVSFTDTGTGIRPADISHVFDPYFTTKPSGRGTGLGLATAYGTMAQLGGGIVVDSELGMGTTLTLWLPTQRSANESVPTPLWARSALVLLADDDNDLREILADELVLIGCDVIEVGDGVAGLEQLDRPIDLLVTDVQMPGLDGVELAESFSGVSPDMPVLFVTGISPKELLGRLPPGANVLRKPFTANEFRTAVTRLLSNRT
jgi:two-component system cell cycle sensor histidine kinase/response regulator CckA